MSNPTREGSTTVGLLRRAREWLTSTIHRSTTIGQQVAAGSFIYQWLTAEPDSEVIVIDLRDMWTVGPIIKIIDRTAQSLIQSAQTSVVVTHTSSGGTGFRERQLSDLSLILITAALGAMVIGGVMGTLSVVSATVLVLVVLGGMFGLGSETTLRELLETTPAQLVISAFEPPESPSSAQSETHETETDEMEPPVDDQ